MKLYNTLTRKVEEFKPNFEGKVKMYTCGPTVYNYSHIGNFRTYIMEDVLEKSLKFLDYDVERVMNITDVGHLTSDADTGEDKMLKGAKRENKSVLEIAKFYTDKFFEDFLSLNLKKPEKIVPATSEIDEYIKPHSIEEKNKININSNNDFVMPNLSPINEEPTPVSTQNEFSIPDLNSINESKIFFRI